MGQSAQSPPQAGAETQTQPSETAADAKAEGKFYGAKPTEYPKWFKESFLNLKTDVEEAKQSGKRVMIMFHQNGCPYCNALIKKNMSQKDIVDQVQKNFDVIALNMWGDLEVTDIEGKAYTEKTFAEALRVQFTPTILFFDEIGKVILRLNGYQPPRQFKTALNYVTEKKEKESNYHDYLKANLPPSGNKELASEDFFSPPPFDLSIKADGQAPLLAVFFEQKDCPNCDRLHEKVLPDPETRAVIKQFKNIQLDMWSNTEVVTPDGRKTTASEWAKELGIKYAPTIVLFDRLGKEVIRSEANFKVFHTQGIYAYVMEGAYQKQPSFQRYLSDRADHFREQGKDVDIWRLAGEEPAERQ